MEAIEHNKKLDDKIISNKLEIDKNSKKNKYASKKKVEVLYLILKKKINIII